MKNTGYVYEDFHDVVIEVLLSRNTINKEYLTDDFVREVYNKLPKDIKATAITWGCSDTVFRDNAFTWLKENWRN